MIDLHAHTTHSDGSLEPKELLSLARATGLEALAITDHDTFSGYDEAVTLAPDGLELVCGIELSCKFGRIDVHLLGYFVNGRPGDAFRSWILQLQDQRRERNRQLTWRLQELGFLIDLKEVEALGRRMTGRPHFARLMIDKGYVRTYEEAFSQYLGEGAVAYVERESPSLEVGIRRIRDGGGVPSLAHPIRYRLAVEEALIERLSDAGLLALEALHTDHSPEDRQRYETLARRYGMSISGGSDFHGAVKPNVKLGSVPVEYAVLEELKSLRP